MRGSSKKKPKAEESGLRKGLTPYPVGERNGDKGKQFPTALKIRLATSSAFWARRRGYAAITCWRLSRKRYIWLLQVVVQEVDKHVLHPY